MGTLSDWSDIVKRQGEERDAEHKKQANEFKELLPGAIEALRQETPENLLSRHLQFSYVGMNHYMAEDIGAYHNAIQAEILRRMRGE